MDKIDYASEKYQKDVDDFLGPDEPHDTDVPISPEEQRKRLRSAQNINRGHPRKGEKREVLKQINVSCLLTFSNQLTEISLKTGKTKRVLIEEAIKHLTKKYAR